MIKILKDGTKRKVKCNGCGTVVIKLYCKVKQQKGGEKQCILTDFLMNVLSEQDL